MLLRLPDPPAAEQSPDALRRDLAACGLLKADDGWDEQHPRTGTPPNPGWFAAKPQASGAAEETPAKVRPGWPSRAAVEKAMEWVEDKAAQLASREGADALIGPNLYFDAIAAFLEVMEPQPTNVGEERLLAQLYANYAPPKTLEELRQPPQNNALGYERHHVVEQNPSNVAKEDDVCEVFFAVNKFGREAIDDDNNLVFVPRLKHELITADYNRKPEGGQPFRRLRDYANTLDFDRQRQIGLEELREYGVLK
ncbi:hypothetical protein [Roseiarcus fermentans]|uniref:hypothetical protein n=1 Tax=Roseiarcus fermentans TaxID=1473586 RepID=UPI0014727733|nr:hypothetical protein [Roseiarcus fermentans]